ncbi:hypothetical protein O53_2101 [Microcystis aeruginosa TAIHU98]|uniref:Uncharacterized protein n=1 Tax=Microcystis aeruginosa TAIHU98 TaxID=1134457 RepID=L7E4R8_MICAE|nr:hypothetical protein O53_2101 [Microcystis aeruginosa TAIHU98]
MVNFQPLFFVLPVSGIRGKIKLCFPKATPKNIPRELSNFATF